MKGGKGKKGLIALLVLLLTAAACGVTYCAYAAQYSDRFIEGTVINGIDAGNKTVSEVEEELRRRVETYSLTLVFMDGQRETLSMSDIGYAYHSDGGVQKILSRQNDLAWIRGKMGETMSYTVGEDFVWDSAKLRRALEALPEMQAENQTAPVDAHMEMGEDHYLTIIPEDNGTQIDESVVFAALQDAVRSGKTEVDVTKLGAYSEASVKSGDADLTNQVNDLNTYLAVTVTYTMYDGTTHVLDNGTTYTWLSVRDDDPDYYYLNTDVLLEKCTEYAHSLAEIYDQTWDSVTFHSTNHGDREYSTGTTGYLIGEADEAAQLCSDILGRASVTRDPVYSLYKERNDTVGDTYVEVDIPNQHVYVYVNGSLYYDCSCVTGLASDPDRRTDPGLFHIYFKDTERTLKGEKDPETGEPVYESFVHYWMAYNGGEGLHDASWRSSFGGDIYQYGGSHGCVNLSYDSAKTIFNAVSVGTAVVVVGS